MLFHIYALEKKLTDIQADGYDSFDLVMIFALLYRGVAASPVSQCSRGSLSSFQLSSAPGAGRHKGSCGNFCLQEFPRWKHWGPFLKTGTRQVVSHKQLKAAFRGSFPAANDEPIVVSVLLSIDRSSFHA